jgi:GH18 family chitinase
MIKRGRLAFWSNVQNFASDARLQLFAMARSAGCKLFLALGNMDKPDMIAADFIEWTQDAQSRENFLAEVSSVVESLNVQGVLFQWYYPGCPKVTDLIKICASWVYIFLHIPKVT